MINKRLSKCVFFSQHAWNCYGSGQHEHEQKKIKFIAIKQYECWSRYYWICKKVTTHLLSLWLFPNDLSCVIEFNYLIKHINFPMHVAHTQVIRTASFYGG